MSSGEWWIRHEAKSIENMPHDQVRARWRRQVALEQAIWSVCDTCPICGEWIGHWGADPAFTREQCVVIPTDLALEEVRPNCFSARVHTLGDAISAFAREREAA